ncbi:MAG: DUF6507 family protein [Pseudolysinimonas sp.]|uniref:DUF6507 family protein n=1 Tax=Pseudolysinimonas sp. TaxID=2680009 RepID=UPI0032658ACB
MASWSVLPDGVWDVTNDVIEVAIPVFDALDGLNDDFVLAINGTRSSAVNDAVVAFLGTAADELQMIQGRVPGAVTAAREATNALNHGDSEMAAIIQSQAVRAGSPPPHGAI